MVKPARLFNGLSQCGDDPLAVIVVTARIGFH